jgi:hypothetical protein
VVSGRMKNPSSLRCHFGRVLLFTSFLAILTATILFWKYSELIQDETNFVLLEDITNGGSHHMHPWLATTLSILFLGFIVFIIILCGDNAG